MTVTGAPVLPLCKLSAVTISVLPGLRIVKRFWRNSSGSVSRSLLSGYFARPGAPEQGQIHPMCSVLVDGGKREGLQPRDPSADRDGRGADLDPIAQDHGPLVGSAENDGDRAGGRFFRLPGRGERALE